MEEKTKLRALIFIRYKKKYDQIKQTIKKIDDIQIARIIYFFLRI